MRLVLEPCVVRYGTRILAYLYYVFCALDNPRRTGARATLASCLCGCKGFGAELS
jgi:hypothetical protein